LFGGLPNIRFSPPERSAPRRQIRQFGIAPPVVLTSPIKRHIGGYTGVRRTEGLLRSVIGAVVQGTRRRENPP
jgi:hypothetical protein